MTNGGIGPPLRCVKGSRRARRFIEQDMDRSGKTIIVTAAAVFALVVVLPYLFNGRVDKELKRREEKSFLSKPLYSLMEQDSLIQAASISLVETGSGREPASAFLARSYYGGDRIVEENYSIGRASITPAGMMLGPTLTFLLDNGYVTPDRMVCTGHGVVSELVSESGWEPDRTIVEYEVATGRDSISVRDGFLLSSRYVADRIALDTGRWDRYIDRLGDYFGSSGAYWLPKVWDHGLITSAYASLADGSGLHLSQGQLLTFYDALANGGVRPRHRYIAKRRICSAETAEAMKGLLRENVTEGTGALLTNHPARIAGMTGTGTVRNGYIPGLSRTVPHDPVETASFVGFFPVESPRYTMCVTIYYKPGAGPVETDLPLDVFGELATKLIKEDNPWRQ